MLRKTILGTLATGTLTGVAMSVPEIARTFAVADWLRTGQPTLPAMVGLFGVVLIAVAGADLARFFVKATTRS